MATVRELHGRFLSAQRDIEKANRLMKVALEARDTAERERDRVLMLMRYAMDHNKSKSVYVEGGVFYLDDRPKYGVNYVETTPVDAMEIPANCD